MKLDLENYGLKENRKIAIEEIREHDFISKQKIKDKIKKLRKELEINKDNVMYQKLIYTAREVVREEIYLLEELLEETNE